MYIALLKNEINQCFRPFGAVANNVRFTYCIFYPQLNPATITEYWHEELFQSGSVSNILWKFLFAYFEVQADKILLFRNVESHGYKYVIIIL